MIVLGILFGLSKGSRFCGSWLSFLRIVLRFSSLFFELIIKCMKGLFFLLETLAAKHIRRDGIQMSANVDADHAACIDSRRSMSGVAVMLAGAGISYFSRTQEVTALVTSESEYVALAEIMEEVFFCVTCRKL